MRILFRNAAIYTAESSELIRSGMLAVDGDKIAYVGTASEEWASKSYDRVIDGTGKLLIPGLINTHSHLAMTLLRGRGSGMPLQRWLEEAIWPTEDRYIEEDYYVASQIGIAEMLLSGVTCFNDMYMGLDQTAAVMKETGMRGVLSRGTVAFSAEMLEPKLRESIDMIRKYNGTENGRIRVMMGPHAEYTNTVETLKLQAEAARELNVGCHIHVSETKKEHEECIGRHGMTPVAVLEQTGILENHAVCAHCVWITKEDMDILASHDAGISHNPASNMKLGSGFAPTAEMLKLGLRVGLGTDGVASNDRTSILAEANLASLAAKASSLDPSALNAEETLRLATLGGAEALGLENEIGSLKAGKQADIVMLDVTGPRWQPEQELMNHMLYSSETEDVVMTMIDGRILMEDRNLLTLDLDKATRDFTRCATRLLAE